MKYDLIIGLDVSKLTFDYSLLDSEGTLLANGESPNTEVSILEWLEELKLKGYLKTSKVLICLENTGFYSNHLLRVLHTKKVGDIWLESGLQIKRSEGISRGKTDKIDALRISTYALDFQRRAKFWRPSSKSLNRLSLLVSHRDRMVKKRQSIAVTLNEQKDYISGKIHAELEAVSSGVLDAFKVAIENLNKRISSLLKEDKVLQRQAEIIKTIPGFGQVIASKLLIATGGFARIKTARKLACYAGVAPFPYQSGTSIKGKTKVSPLANKEIKKMLHLAALVTIRKGNIMEDYFKRKVAEGKNKMSVINAIRNKLIHILMACIDNDTIYQRNYKHSLVIT